MKGVAPAMKTSCWPVLPAESSGLTLIELLVTLAIFAIVVLGLGTLYLSATQAMDEGSAAVFLQRQGTQIQEELAIHVQRATVLEVDPPGATQGLCHPSGGLNLPPGKSIIYQRTVGSSSDPTNPATNEAWCVYEHKRPADPYAQLWRCRVSGLTPPQICATAPENLVASTLRGFRGLPIGVSRTCFAPAGTNCPPPSPTCVGCPMSVDVTFTLDVKRAPTDPRSLLGGPREFGFNITIRN